MHPTPAAALELLAQLADSVALTGPQRRQVDAALASLRDAVTPPAKAGK